MGLGIPPIEIKIMLESSPPKSIILVQRLAVGLFQRCVHFNPADPILEATAGLARMFADLSCEGYRIISTTYASTIDYNSMALPFPFQAHVFVSSECLKCRLLN